MSISRFYSVALASLLVLLLHGTLPAQWSDNPGLNTPVTLAPNSQSGSAVVSDGAGGIIAAWQDYRNFPYERVYLQRMSAAGIPVWPVNGLQGCTFVANQARPTLMPDGTGGVIVVWSDDRDGKVHLYAQRIDSTGAYLWNAEGVRISDPAADEFAPALIPDGSGGALIAWADTRNGNSDIYAQRINGAGVIQWSPSDVAVCRAGMDQVDIHMISDNAGGGILSWEDFRDDLSGFDFNPDVYAQRISGSGRLLWVPDTVDPNGLPIAVDLPDRVPVLATDGAGGAIIVWAHGGTAIKAQRVNSAGSILWAVDGMMVDTGVSTRFGPVVTSDSSGGVMTAWTDLRSGQYDVYAERFDSNGTIFWTGSGIQLSTVPTERSVDAIVSDSRGGAFLSWMENPSGKNEDDIYGQHLDRNGQFLWTPEGVAVSTAAGTQVGSLVVPGPDGSAVFLWSDGRTGSYHPYAQKVMANGLLGDGAVKITAVNDVKNDQGGFVNVLWRGSAFDVPGDIGAVSSYLVFRGVKRAPVTSGARLLPLPEYMKLKTSGRLLPNYYMKGTPPLPLADTIYWQYIGGVTARMLPAYAYTVPTLADSGPQGSSTEYFMVTTNVNAGGYWMSAPDSGHSLDNLPPVARNSISAQNAGGSSVRVAWNPDLSDPDVGAYAVHRSSVSGFIPGPATQIGVSRDTFFIDTHPLGSSVDYYRVVTVDVHGNASIPSPEASVTLAGLTPETGAVPDRFALAQNYPNPFNPATTIGYQLPAGGYVSLRVYDMLGSLVATLADGIQSAGYRSAVFDASNLPSGIYVYRLRAGSFNETRKLVLIR